MTRSRTATPPSLFVLLLTAITADLEVKAKSPSYVEFQRDAARKTITEFAALLGVAYLVPPALWLGGQIGPWWLLTLLSAPLAVTLAARVRTATGRDLVPVLIGTSRLIFVHGALFAMGIAL